jgi:hypothetical protein
VPLADGQIQILRPGGPTILLNDGAPPLYEVTRFDPWNRGARADQTGVVPWGDGEWSGAEWRTATTIPLEIEMDRGTWPALMAAYWPLDAVLDVVRTGPEAEITWGAGGVEYLMYGRPRGATLHHRSLAHGTARVTSSLYCPDPTIYSATEYVTETGLYRTVSGMTVPTTVPAAVYSAVADGVVTLTNAGSQPAALRLTIPGPVIDPSITVIPEVGEPETLFLNVQLGTGDVLTVDTAAEEVALNGAVSLLWGAYGDWPLLAPGTSTLEYRAAGPADSPSRLTIRHRDTY